MSDASSNSLGSLKSTGEEGVDFHYVRSTPKRPKTSQARATNLLPAKDEAQATRFQSTPTYLTVAKFNLPKEQTLPNSSLLLWPQCELTLDSQRLRQSSGTALYHKTWNSRSEIVSLIATPGEDKEHKSSKARSAKLASTTASNPVLSKEFEKLHVAVDNRDDTSKESRASTNGQVHETNGKVGNDKVTIPQKGNEVIPTPNEARSRARPLENIKIWSIRYFEQEDPELAAENMAYQDRSDRMERISHADTRSIASDATELVPQRVENMPWPAATNGVRNEWLEFVGQQPADRVEHYLPELPVKMEVSEWDGDCVIPGEDTYQSVCWAMGHQIAANIDRWIQLNVNLKHRHIIDTSHSLFRSGNSRPSGLLHERAVYPPEMLYEQLEPDYGPIDWNKIPLRRALEDQYLTPFQRRQSSELCRQIIVEPWQKLVAKAESARLKTESPKTPPVPKQKKSAGRIQMEVQQAGEELDAQHRKDAMTAYEHFYIRPARRSDAPQLCRIYNEWVIEAVVTNTADMRELGVFEDAVEINQRAGLPFLVAASRSARAIREEPAGRLRRNQYHQQQRSEPTRKERVVGFVTVESLTKTRGSVFKDVIEIELFTDRHRLHRGIGKVLLDRALSFIIPCYGVHSGTSFEFDRSIDGDFYVFGSFSSPKIIRKILIQLLWRAEDGEELEWKKRMLEDKFGFRQAGFYEGFATRGHRSINVTTMVRDVMRRVRES